MSVSILLVEDHAGFAQALLNMLGQKPNLEVTAVADSGESAMEQLRASEFDLVLVDYSLPDMSGINLVKMAHEEFPDTPCVMLSGHLSLQYAQRALEAGARGYLIKDNPLGILTGIQHVLQGGIYVSEELRSSGSSGLLTDFT